MQQQNLADLSQAELKALCRVPLRNVRLSYTHLDEPWSGGNGDDANTRGPVYSVQVLIPKDDKDTLRKLAAAVKVARYRGKYPDNMEFRNKPIRNGDTDNPKEHTKGHYYITPKNSDQPPCIPLGFSKDNYPQLTSAEIKQQFYSGIWANVVVEAYPFGMKPGSKQKGVTWSLAAVKKVKDGDRLDNRATVNDLPDDMPEDDDMEFGGASKGVGAAGAIPNAAPARQPPAAKPAADPWDDDDTGF